MTYLIVMMVMTIKKTLYCYYHHHNKVSQLSRGFPSLSSQQPTIRKQNFAFYSQSIQTAFADAFIQKHTIRVHDKYCQYLRNLEISLQSYCPPTCIALWLAFHQWRFYFLKSRADLPHREGSVIESPLGSTGRIQEFSKGGRVRREVPQWGPRAKPRKGYESEVSQKKNQMLHCCKILTLSCIKIQDLIGKGRSGHICRYTPWYGLHGRSRPYARD